MDQAGEAKGDYSETNYDEFAGYGEKLFGDTPYEEDDAEADKIWEAVDDRMDSRRKRRREERLLETMKKYRIEKPKISDQFADLKRDLTEVSVEEWSSIPDIGDYSLKLKQPKTKDRAMPMPDNIIQSARNESGLGAHTALDPRQQKYGGMETPVGGMMSVIAGGSSSVVGISGMAEARGHVIKMKLDKMSDSVSGQTVVDPKGYLTDLNSVKVTSDAEVGDILKARTLLQSVTGTNPKHGPGWIAAARLEEVAGKMVQARRVIARGCEACPDSEDVWLEAARLQTPANAKTVLASAIRHLPQSVKIWVAAAELETDEAQKKLVLRRALELVPNSVKLWKAAVELEESADDARVLLGRAVECVPHSVDMWLALARLESYDNARMVLNMARQAVPMDPTIWIAAAKLEEAQLNSAMVDKLVEKGVKHLSALQVLIDRETWLKEAEAAEAAGAPLTCGAIVRHTLHIGVEPEDRKRTWCDDADAAQARGSSATARAIYAHALTLFPSKKSVWLRAAALEKRVGTAESLDAMLRKAVAHCPRAEILWLMAAKEAWLGGDVAAARTILMEAFKANPESEQIWLAAVKLEWENGEFERARLLLAKARERAPTARVWMKSAVLERQSGALQAAAALLHQALALYPSFDKLYMMGGHLLERGVDRDELATQALDGPLGPASTAAARRMYQQGVRRCPASVPLWTLASRLDERSSVTKARSVLELARLQNPGSAALYVEAIRLELRSGHEKLATSLLAKAQQELPEDGLLWALAVAMAPRPAQRSKSADALKKCDKDALVVATVANLFQLDRKPAKARKWFNRAATMNPDQGDVWAAYYAFELAHGGDEEQRDVLARVERAEPHHGENWARLAKSDRQRGRKPGELLRLLAPRFAGAKFIMMVGLNWMEDEE